MASKSNPGGGFGSVGKAVPKKAPANPGGGFGSIGTQTAKAAGAVGVGVGGAKIPVPAAATPGAAPGDPTTGLTGADAVLAQDLAQWGLGSMASQLWNDHLNGANNDQLMFNLRNSPTYQQRFAGLIQLQQKYGTSIDESTYMGMEDQVRQTLHNYGVDPSQVSQSYVGSILGADVSNSELQQRLQNYTAVINDPGMAPVRQYYQQHFGLGTNDLMNYWLDPDTSVTKMNQQVAASQIGAAAQTAGFGTLDVTNALSLAQQGVTASGAQSGFGKAASQQGLTQSIGDGTTDVTNQDLIDATFNSSADAQAKIDKAGATRVSRFTSGGGFASSSAGVGGLGSATDAAL